ncbi:hypothetical protein HJG53_09990 [Sphingomonas sp. ID1715]|uniref:hypothetical protein n=1 Tax=Sphingomonas sp. ID1715 TaxID=1656898 RepID=UPI001488B40A|nr:hypothetical protein [Sphingomonas sp. ID1715]NNM77233.1 hypothetical protein [Sphingomonas sp. ID1715]
MTRPLPRAILFAILALILSAVLSAIVLLILVGVPSSRDAAAEFQREAIARSVNVDLIVGGLVALAAGWLAARPFRGREALVTGALTGLVFILCDLAIVLLVGNAERLNFSIMGAAYADKLAAATLGGWLAGRRAQAPPETMSLDRE